MQGRELSRDIREVVLAAVGFLLLFHGGLLALVSLIPLQSLLKRRGKTLFLAAGGVIIAVLVAMRMGALLQDTGTEALWGLVMDGGFVVLVAAGLYFVEEKGAGIFPARRLILALMATGVFALVTYPPALYFTREGALKDSLMASLQEILLLLGGQSEASSGTFLQGVDTEQVYAFLRQAVLSSYWVVYFTVVIIGWRGGTLWAERRQLQGKRSDPLVGFRVPQEMIWIVLLPLTVELFYQLLHMRGGSQIPLSVVMAGRNLLYVMAFVYGIQGAAILQFWMRKKISPHRLTRLMPIAVLVMLIIWPANIIVLLGLVLLGVAENWLTLRKDKRSSENDEGNSE